MTENKPEFILIHCSDVSYKEMPNQFWAINRWHKEREFPVSSLGYYVGYHRLSSGGIEYKAREDREVGAHCNQIANGKSDSFNFYSLGYCLAFDGDIEYPPQKDVDNMIRTIRGWQQLYAIPLERVIFHRKPTPRKTCPGSLIPDDYFSRMLAPVPHKEPDQKEKQENIKRLSSILDQLRALYERLMILLSKR